MQYHHWTLGPTGNKAEQRHHIQVWFMSFIDLTFLSITSLPKQSECPLVAHRGIGTAKWLKLDKILCTPMVILYKKYGQEWKLRRCEIKMKENNKQHQIRYQIVFLLSNTRLTVLWLKTHLFWKIQPNKSRNNYFIFWLYFRFNSHVFGVCCNSAAWRFLAAHISSNFPFLCPKHWLGNVFSDSLTHQTRWWNTC